MENKKGFTLIELLAVIVILAIILAIAIPGISGIVKSSTMSSMKSDAKLVLKAIELKKLGDDSFNPLDYNSNLEGLLSALKLSGENYESVVFTNNSGKTLVSIEGKGKWDGLTACGSYHNMIVSEEVCELDLIPPVITINGDNPMEVDEGGTYDELGATVTDNSVEELKAVITGFVNIDVVGEYTITYTATDSSGNIATTTRTINVVKISYAGPEYIPKKGVNGPLLAQGMTPIKRSGDTWVDTDIYDSEWYNYTEGDKKWANVRTNDCDTPGNIETCSMWVWIPRYAYQIASGYHLSSTGTINIKFLQGATNTTQGGTQIYEDSLTNAHFVKHPAFNFGSTEMTGMWVAKFEHAFNNATLESKPGVTPLTYTTIGNMFITSRNMEKIDRYGWNQESGTLDTSTGLYSTNINNIDFHMMKNTEWGAVAYLAQSTYGKSSKIATNVSSVYTGGGSGTAYATNVEQSTTGTIYGIYDMSGGAYEYVMGNFNKTQSSAGLSPNNINGKYINIYPSSGTYSSSFYGDATYETSGSSINATSWHGEYSGMISSSNPWFIRGGKYNDYTISGVFYFSSYNGGGFSNTSWRSVILVGEGL